MATKRVAWNDGSGDYITLDYQGQGDGPVSIVSDENGGPARSKSITLTTTKGSPVITKNVTINQAAAPVQVGDILNFAYTGSGQQVTLPKGRYKLQCWGAQGGSNGTNSTYGITAKAGGKGGYAEGVLTIAQKTILRVYVGGKGGASAGGYPGGGATVGSSSYNSDGEFGISYMGGGGGATDIRLSDGSLLSRMIVAGGGSGGAMAYKEITSTTTQTIIKSTFPYLSNLIENNIWYGAASGYGCYLIDVSSYKGCNLKFTVNQSTSWGFLKADPVAGQAVSWAGQQTGLYFSASCDGIIPYDAKWLYIYSGYNKVRDPSDLTLTQTTTSGYADSHNGYAGGGTTSDARDSGYSAKQNAAGNGGSFGQGAQTLTSTLRYCSGGGGGGWYGGGAENSNIYLAAVSCSGGGSGFVNTAASAANRPSGYTGLQLDSGETIAGTQSFPAPGGGNETGHSGNGYARITRLS